MTQKERQKLEYMRTQIISLKSYAEAIDSSFLKHITNSLFETIESLTRNAEEERE